jgi:hypothetical protein
VTRNLLIGVDQLTTKIILAELFYG